MNTDCCLEKRARRPVVFAVVVFLVVADVVDFAVVVFQSQTSFAEIELGDALPPLLLYFDLPLQRKREEIQNTVVVAVLVDVLVVPLQARVEKS